MEDDIDRLMNIALNTVPYCEDDQRQELLALELVVMTLLRILPKEQRDAVADELVRMK